MCVSPRKKRRHKARPKKMLLDSPFVSLSWRIKCNEMESASEISHTPRRSRYVKSATVIGGKKRDVRLIRTNVVYVHVFMPLMHCKYS